MTEAQSKQMLNLLDQLALLTRNQFDRLNKKIEYQTQEINQRFEKIEQGLDKVDARLDKIERKLDEVNLFKRLVAHNSIQIEQLRDAIKPI